MEVEPSPVLTKLPPRPKPKLVAARREPPAGAVGQIMTDALEPARGQRVELGQGYLRYAAVCKAQSQEPVTPDQYMDAMVTFCKGIGIRTRIIGDKLYLMDVQLTEQRVQASH